VKNVKRREYQEKIDELLRIIHWLDGYRTFRVADPSRIELSIERICPPKIVKRWKRVRKEIREMNRALSESPLRNLLAMASILRFVSLTCIMGLFFSFMALMIFRIKVSLSYPTIMVVVVIAVVIIPNFYLYFDRYLRHRIKSYYEKAEDRFGFKMKKVKSLAQELIYYVSELVKKAELDPNKLGFKLNNVDYDGIEVKSKPKFFSKFYTVRLTLDKVNQKNTFNFSGKFKRVNEKAFKDLN